jgi:hypothetical protein
MLLVCACVCVCVRERERERERESYTVLEDRNGKALDWKEITHHFRRWGQRNET